MTQLVPTPRPTLWSIRQVADYWSVHPRKVYRDAKKGAIKVVEIHGVLRVPCDEALSYGQERTFEDMGGH